MPQSPELAGGAGFTFEDAVSATYLAALLQQGFAPGIQGRTVCRVALQQRDLGEPLDDVIVDFRTDGGELARLSLQVKRSLTISKAESNTDFRDIVRDSWATLNKGDFRKGIDRFGAAVGEVATARSRDLRRLCEFARSSVSVADFEARFTSKGNASAEVRAIRDDIETLIAETSGAPCSNQSLQEFLAHFVLVKFDALHEGETIVPNVLNSLRACLASPDASQSSALWDRLRVLARDGAGKSAVFDRPSLVRRLAPTFQLASAPSFRKDLEQLKSLAKQWLADIEDDVGGTRLDRADLLAELEAKLATSRWVQIRGLPGSGKSVLLRHHVEAALARGPVLFLKSGRLEGTGWPSFAASNGLSADGLPDLLVEIAATGLSTLYIDGIDRIEKQHQPIVLDVIRAIMGNPLLDNWRILVSLRDTGIEPLRNWLGKVLSLTSVATVEVRALDDKESSLLAKAKPHLSALLFGPKQVREIVRRPFFAKVLNSNFGASAGDNAFQPQSEVDLIGNWWMRGGYNADGQNALERQRAIIELGSFRARHLDGDIPVRELSHATLGVVDQLVADGILQHVRQGISLRFSHDIFFEWAFFHVLADLDQAWLEGLRGCGEPPAVARVVELMSQWQFSSGTEWGKTLRQIDASEMRSQWTRAWLLAPLSASNFEQSQQSYDAEVSTDDHRFLKKALVWFQAERTTPNETILAGDLPRDERIRIADLLGWPSDIDTWSRFIVFLLKRVTRIPVALYPDIVSLFEVWQNAFAAIKNPLSDALLDQVAAWLGEIEKGDAEERPPVTPSRWKPLGSDLGDFRKTLTRLILRSAVARRDLTENYLSRVIASKDLRRREFSELVLFSPILAQSHPNLLVDLTLKHLKSELPEERQQREREELKRSAGFRKRALEKPAEQRSRAEKFAAEGHFMLSRGMHSFDYHDWQALALNGDTENFFPASPLREPFHSLFASAPDQALRLISELSNHVMTAWRQLHRLSHDSHGTPVPLEITFPWGKQQFWGGDREYLWHRSTWAPKALACGYLALEEWALAELERGRPVDELVQQIVTGNECIAVLGIAIGVALQAHTATEAVFPIVTSQRLIAADHNRMRHDLTNSTAGLIGFSGKSDLPHVTAINKANARAIRRYDLRWLVMLYFMNAAYHERTRAAILNFVNDLPFQIEEHRRLPAAQEHLIKEAREYAELVDMKNYEQVPAPDGGDKMAIVHVSPTATSPEKVAKAEEAGIRLREMNLWTWGAKYYERGEIGEGFTVPSAIEFAKTVDSPELYQSTDGEELGDMRRGAVAVAAAIALDRREGLARSDLAWARGVLKRAKAAPERKDALRSSQSVIPWHQSIFVARGLAVDLRHGTAERSAARDLLTLVAHPLEAVSLAALGAALSLWDEDPRLGWAALHLALSLCILPDWTQPRGPGEDLHTQKEIQAAIKAATRLYEKTKGWPELPLPPPAWVRVTGTEKKVRPWDRYHGDLEPEDLVDPNETWAPSATQWYSQYAATIIGLVPFEKVLSTDAAPKFLAFLSGQLTWTIANLEPPWVRRGRRYRRSPDLIEWTNGLGTALAKAAGLRPLADFETKFLNSILDLEDEHCWELLAPFVDTYICAYVYDASRMPDDAPALLKLCLERFLKAPELDPQSYRPGELHGFDQPKLARSLMFVSVESAMGAARYVNGDWSDIAPILPIVDQFVRASGWASGITSLFLTLCERARAVYPADQFADEVLHVLGKNGPPLRGWHGTLLPARIAGLVQHFADRETPMSPALGQKLLRILDQLVDMGDRRSAALQLSETFREIQTV